MAGVLTCERTIYDLAIDPKQIRRELRSSTTTPVHAAILGIFVYPGFFGNENWLAGMIAAPGMTLPAVARNSSP